MSGIQRFCLYGTLLVLWSWLSIGQLWSQCVADAGPDTTICAGESVVLGTPGVAGVAYVWQPGGSLSDSTDAQPTATPDTTTRYVLVASNGPGCVNVDTVTILDFGRNPLFSIREWQFSFPI